MASFRILLADKDSVFREGLKALLATSPEFEVVAEAGTASETVALTAKLKPDVVVIDIKLPNVEANGAVTEAIVQLNPNVRVLVLTEVRDDLTLFTALRAGARGYLLKEANHAEILRALQAVAHGEAIVSAALAERMTNFFKGLPSPHGFEHLSQLTAREREVLHLLEHRLSNKDIARQLNLRPKTVRNHVSSIVGKLQVANRIEAGLKAREELN